MEWMTHEVFLIWLGYVLYLSGSEPVDRRIAGTLLWVMGIGVVAVKFFTR